MKPFIASFLLGLTVLTLAQNPLELKQQWQILEGENTWVVSIVEETTPELYRADLVSGEIAAEHELYVRVDRTEEELAFTFMFHNMMVTDSGFGFTCELKSAGAEAELVRYIGTIGGPQWSEEKESCTLRLQEP